MDGKIFTDVGYGSDGLRRERTVGASAVISWGFVSVCECVCEHLFQPFLPHLSALPLHHVETGQHHQLRLKLIQAGHKHFQCAHLTVGHIVREDEAVGLGRPGGGPLFTWGQEINAVGVLSKGLWLQLRVGLCFTFFVLQNEVKLIRLLEGFRWNQNLLVQHLVEFGTNRAT